MESQDVRCYILCRPFPFSNSYADIWTYVDCRPRAPLTCASLVPDEVAYPKWAYFPTQAATNLHVRSRAHSVVPPKSFCVTQREWLCQLAVRYERGHAACMLPTRYEAWASIQVQRYGRKDSNDLVEKATRWGQQFVQGSNPDDGYRGSEGPPQVVWVVWGGGLPQTDRDAETRMSRDKVFSSPLQTRPLGWDAAWHGKGCPGGKLRNVDSDPSRHGAAQGFRHDL